MTALTVDSWSDKDQQIEVAEGNGYPIAIKLRAKLFGTPATVYEVLTDPDAVSVFRSIKASIMPWIPAR